jgi:hypoxanthine-guanine phosphoribosyltransferase
MDQVCELVARLTGAPQVFVYIKAPNAKKIEVVGRFGFLPKNLSLDWHIAELAERPGNALAISSARESAYLIGNPVLKMVPEVKSLLAFSVGNRPTKGELVLIITNPEANIFTDSERITALMLLVHLLGPNFVQKLAETVDVGFAEQNHSPGILHKVTTIQEDRSTEAFLFNTLPIKHRLLARNGISYIGLSTWRQSLKEFQIAALKGQKEALSKSFLEAIAQEMASAISTHYGSGSIRNVVPVPCGSSGRNDCFSVRLAETLALHLGCRFANVLKSSAERGTSHPRKSARLSPFDMEGTLEGQTLVVDDVITSGKHMEMAVKVLRANHVNCFAIGWIAG